jgi:hypothetical protein
MLWCERGASQLTLQKDTAYICVIYVISILSTALTQFSTFLAPVLGIRDFLVQIRIRGSVPQTKEKILLACQNTDERTSQLAIYH